MGEEDAEKRGREMGAILARLENLETRQKDRDGKAWQGTLLAITSIFTALMSLIPFALRGFK